MTTLSQCLQGMDYRIAYDRSFYPDGVDGLSVCAVCYDSRRATPGSAFVCVPGAKADGHDFAAQVYNQGVRVFIVNRLPEALAQDEAYRDAVFVYVADSRIALAQFSANFFHHPERELTVLGITGTKGKSTVAYMVARILEDAGKSVGIIGTCGIVFGGHTEPSANTTPESCELFRIMRTMADAGCTHVVMEVSSQALMLHRVYGLRFAVAAMTNLSLDHVGTFEHPTFEHYASCKKMLFAMCDAAVLNADDAYFENFREACTCPEQEIAAYSLAEAGARTLSQETLRESFDALGAHFDLPQPGDFSVLNALCAVKVAQKCGVDAAQAASALRDVVVPGRFEVVPTCLSGVRFIIDYAHNGLSLTAALQVLRSLSPARLVCLFGTFGGRSEVRRRELAQACEAADFAIITSDNPDHEDPDAIIAQIASYITHVPYVCITDREEAIAYAVKNALPGDIVLLAGKGHEDYQLIDGVKRPFCERDLLLKYARRA